MTNEKNPSESQKTHLRNCFFLLLCAKTFFVLLLVRIRLQIRAQTRPALKSNLVLELRDLVLHLVDVLSQV